MDIIEITHDVFCWGAHRSPNGSYIRNGVFGELPVPSVFLGAYTSPVFLFWCAFVYFVKRIVGNPEDLSRERWRLMDYSILYSSYFGFLHWSECLKCPNCHRVLSTAMRYRIWYLYILITYPFKLMSHALAMLLIQPHGSGFLVWMLCSRKKCCKGVQLLNVCSLAFVR